MERFAMKSIYLSIGITLLCSSAFAMEDTSATISVPQLYQIPAKQNFDIESQQEIFDLDALDCISQQPFRTLFEEQTKNGQPFLFCRAVTHGPNYIDSYVHHFSTQLLSFLYGPNFPHTIKTDAHNSLAPKMNPLNNCPFDNTIDIMLGQFNPATQNCTFEKLGTDLSLIRGNQRLKNIVSLSLGNFSSEKQEKDIALTLSSDANQTIAHYGSLQLARYYLKKLETSSKNGFKKETYARKAMVRLKDTANKPQENYDAALHAMQLFVSTAYHKSYSSLLAAYPWIKQSAQNYCDYLTKQEYNLLLKDRALIQKAQLLECTDEQGALEKYKQVASSLRSPTKNQFAAIKVALLDVTKLESEKIAIAQKTLEECQEYTNSPETHRRRAAQATENISLLVLAQSNIEPKKPVKRTLFQ